MFSAYIFEAKSVQAYILAGGRLRDIVGGSSLLDWMTSADSEYAPLATLKEKFDIDSFVRAAGGAVTVSFSDDKNCEKAREFRALWRFQVGNAAPGMHFSDGIGEGGTLAETLKKARVNVRENLSIRRAELPQATPLMAQSQRMAAPAAHVSEVTNADGICKITKEYSDRATLAKRHFIKPSHHPGADRLGARLAGRADCKWPNEFEEGNAGDNSIIFPFGGSEEHEIAIVHADGDGIGKKIIALADKPDGNDQIKSVSEKLTLATINAAIMATKAILLPKADTKVVAARPVLLGGDDLTMIIRADLALDFLMYYCDEFQRQTRKEFDNFPTDHPFRDGLTASGAAVFIRARQPFSKALKLTEALTKHAKKEGGGHTSFFRCTTSKIPATLEEAWMNPAQRPEPCDMARFEKLKQLAVVLRDDAVGRSGLRLFLEADEALSQSVWDRTCKIMDKRSNADDPASVKIIAALEDLSAIALDDKKVVLHQAFLLNRLGG